MDWIVTLPGQHCIYHLHMIIVRVRRGLIMSIGFRQRNGFRPWRVVVRTTCNLESRRSFNISISIRQRKGFGLRTNVVRAICTSAGRPSAEHLCQYLSAEGLQRITFGGQTHKSRKWPWQGGCLYRSIQPICLPKAFPFGFPAPALPAPSDFPHPIPLTR